MNTSHPSEDARLAALCNRLGRLWSEEDVDVWDDEIPPEKLQECKATLVGKILSDPSVNFQALQSTLTRVWRNDHVQISQPEEGLYVFKFNSETERQRILHSGHWLFGHHLLILKPWLPNTPLHCYDFTTCEFWVQIFGLPLERCTASMFAKAARHLGQVQEVSLATKENSAVKTGRVRVNINLNEPLKSGKLLRLEGQNIWIDFKYERLSYYCY
ncbi:hypothetical protein EUGRSUZ_L03030 [Eucalyptus grandis]|uniref:DUF4283 domain-containing protein n=1 Tax=Eucalyptus grandis TaxID=71139 RepID=A0AAD9T830_EUCGR|nr:hypothetical protein EUGRSUZ_L03030 [Eucalyptus grandis]